MIVYKAYNSAKILRMNNNYPEFQFEPPRRSFLKRMIEDFTILTIAVPPTILALYFAFVNLGSQESVVHSEYQQPNVDIPIGDVYYLEDDDTGLKLFCINMNTPDYGQPDFNSNLTRISSPAEGFARINQVLTDEQKVPDYVEHIYIINGQTFIVNPKWSEKDSQVTNRSPMCETADVTQLISYIAKNNPHPAQTPTPLTP